MSPDGKYLIVRERSLSSEEWDLAAVAVDDPGEPVPLLSSEANKSSAAISPDGTLLAFVTDETGRSEVIVTRFPDVGARIPVSTHGGTEPVWSRSGEEIYFREGRRLISVRRPPRRDRDPRRGGLARRARALSRGRVSPPG